MAEILLICASFLDEENVDEKTACLSTSTVLLGSVVSGIFIATGALCLR